jgi:endonuclease/exonuclease/phosphatase (EEP) superfamily protein YafD
MLGALAELIEGGRMARNLGACRAGDPVVVVGDLNALPVWKGIRRLGSRGLVDTYAAARRRPTGTWSAHPWLPRIARIDYIFAPEGTDVRGAWAVGLPGSDHRLVVADLVPPR